METLQRVWLFVLNRGREQGGCLLDSSVIVKMMVINIFYIHHAADTYKGRFPNHLQSQLKFAVSYTQIM